MNDKNRQIGALILSVVLIALAVGMFLGYQRDNTVTEGDAPIAKNHVNPHPASLDSRKNAVMPPSNPDAPKGRSAGGSGMVLDPPK